MTQRVLIVTVPRQDVVRPPGILAILAACCEQASANYEIFDLNLYMHRALPNDMVSQLNADFTINKFSAGSDQAYSQVCNEVNHRIEQYQPTILAISVFTYESILATKHLLECLKPGSYKIVIGGLGVSSEMSHITGEHTFGTWCLQNRLVDYAITGEGELSFVELLRGNIDYPGINGLPSQQLLNLDTLPSPSYRKIRPQDYYYSNQPEILITGSKGCVRDCTFCDVGHYWKKYIYRSGEKIADDFYKIWQETGVQKFDFSDSLINGSLKSFRAFNRRLIELRRANPDFKPQYKGQFICRPIGQMKRQDYIDMKEAGAETLVVGIEHFSEHIRTHMRKDFDNDAIDWHFATCAELGIKNMLLILSGYLTETSDDHKINLEYLQRYQRYALTRIITAINIAVGGLIINKGMPLYDLAHEMGLVIDESNLQTWVNPANPTLTPHERLRRAVEIIYTAANLNYNVLHFTQKVSTIKRLITEIDKPTARKTIPIMPCEVLS
jgi:hypothetical protein